MAVVVVVMVAAAALVTATSTKGEAMVVVCSPREAAMVRRGTAKHRGTREGGGYRLVALRDYDDDDEEDEEEDEDEEDEEEDEDEDDEAEHTDDNKEVDEVADEVAVEGRRQGSKKDKKGAATDTAAAATVTVTATKPAASSTAAKDKKPKKKKNKTTTTTAAAAAAHDAAGGGGKSRAKTLLERIAARRWYHPDHHHHHHHHHRDHQGSGGNDGRHHWRFLSHLRRPKAVAVPPPSATRPTAVEGGGSGGGDGNGANDNDYDWDDRRASSIGFRGDGGRLGGSAGQRRRTTAQSRRQDAATPTAKKTACIKACAAIALVAAVVTVALVLALVRTTDVDLYPLHPLGSFECAENLCRFPFTDYPRAVACRDRFDCMRYFDPCASNPCRATGTAYCETTSKGDHECVCKEGYGGRHCHLRLHPCDHDDPCLGDGSSCKKIEHNRRRRPVRAGAREDAGRGGGGGGGGHGREATVTAYDADDDHHRYRCKCATGRYGKDCRYRTRVGDTCTRDSHCHGGESDHRRQRSQGKCVQESSSSSSRNGEKRRCRCPIRRHGVHCEKTFQVDDCLLFGLSGRQQNASVWPSPSPCGSNDNACIERDVGFHCHCRGHLAGRRCQVALDRTACRHLGRCKNGGRCDDVDADLDDRDGSRQAGDGEGGGGGGGNGGRRRQGTASGGHSVVSKCTCVNGYGGIDCGVLDVSTERAKKTWSRGRCKDADVDKDDDDDDDQDEDEDERRDKKANEARHRTRRPYNGTRPRLDLVGDWYLASTTDNAFNPRDECPRIHVLESRAGLQGVAVGGSGGGGGGAAASTAKAAGWLAVEYAAMRNDTSSHFRVVKTRLHETRTAIRAVWRNATLTASGDNDGRDKKKEEEKEEDGEEGGGHGEDDEDDDDPPLPFLVQMTGALVRDYTYPMKSLDSFDRLTVTYRPLLYDREHLTLHACIWDDTHGAIESLLLFSRTLEPSSLARVRQRLEQTFPGLAGKTVDHQDYDACRRKRR